MQYIPYSYMEPSGEYLEPGGETPELHDLQKSVRYYRHTHTQNPKKAHEPHNLFRVPGEDAATFRTTQNQGCRAWCGSI